MTDILLPDSVQTYQCRVPGCDQHFLNESAYIRHVPRCAQRHRERLISLSEEHQDAVDKDPFERVWDPEALEWVQRRRREGRSGYTL